MFYVEPVIGYRSWRVADDGSDRLGSAVVHGCWWPSDEALSALCWDTQHRHYKNDDTPIIHDAPHKDCTCGLYAFHDVDDVFSYGAHSRSMLGAVAAWGRITIHTIGFRAEHMRPLGFIEHKSKLERLHRREMIEHVVARYGIPLLPQHDLVDYAETFGKPLGASYLDD